VTAIRTTLRRLLSAKRGATAIEYGLIAALIAVACIGAMRMLGGGSGGMWTIIAERVTGANDPV
jgi:pilus assembly protein Flp/PilA